MKVNTKERKKARKGFQQVHGDRALAEKMFHILKQIFYSCEGVRV